MNVASTDLDAADGPAEAPQELTRKRVPAAAVLLSLKGIAKAYGAVCALAGVMLRRLDARLVASIGLILVAAACFQVAHGLTALWSSEQFAQTLRGLRAKLKRGGTLNILQPNYRFAYREYFDDYTHVAVYSDRSLADFLSVNGFEVKECHARFLPLTIKSKMPVSAALIRLYLASPVKPMGKQMLLRAVRLDHSAA